MQCEGDAATYFDSVPHLAAVMDKAMDGVATLADLAVVEASLNSRFPSKIIDQDSVGGDINSLTQEKDEALLAYYNRALSALHRVGCKDAAVGITLTMPEKTVLTSLVRQFVKGLADSGIVLLCPPLTIAAVTSLYSFELEVGRVVLVKVFFVHLLISVAISDVQPGGLSRRSRENQERQQCSNNVVD
ncbi:hypothetical protein CTA2_5099 [Colletotrichum tanaceti]|nr:hypothetical protein CTA2_5099 [Colletotrichum tanaceti]